MIHLVHVLCLLSLQLAACQISKAHSQPWPVKYDGFGSCCSLLKKPKPDSSATSNELDLLQTDADVLEACVTKVMHGQSWDPLPAQTVAFLSLAADGAGQHRIENVSLYRSYQMGAVGAYCEHHGYAFRSLTALPANTAQEVDFRWHKIHLIMDALNEDSGWARHVEYLVWIGKAPSVP